MSRWRFAWNLAAWPAIGAMAFFSDGWTRAMWICFMVVLGLLLEVMRFLDDRLSDVYEQTIKRQEREIQFLGRYRQAVLYAQGKLAVKPPHLREGRQ